MSGLRDEDSSKGGALSPLHYGTFRKRPRPDVVAGIANAGRGIRASRPTGITDPGYSGATKLVLA